MTASTARAVAVAAVGDVPPGGVHAVTVEGRPVVLAELDGRLVAFDGACSHAGGPLGKGSIADGRLQCPWHRATFDLRTGAPCAGPARKTLRRYPIRVEAGTVLVVLD